MHDARNKYILWHTQYSTHIQKMENKLLKLPTLRTHDDDRA